MPSSTHRFHALTLGGELVGSNPTDRARIGSKYHIAIDGDGVPVAYLATSANVPGTLLFERLFLTALAVMARIRRVLKLHFLLLDDT